MYNVQNRNFMGLSLYFAKQNLKQTNFLDNKLYVGKYRNSYFVTVERIDKFSGRDCQVA